MQALEYIYQPEEIAFLEQNFQFGVQEWADAQSINLCIGCANDCVYCYARAGALFHKRISDWANWKQVIFKERVASRQYSRVRKARRIMFPTTHDIPSEPAHIRQACIDFIFKQLCQRKLDVLITTKPRLDVIKEICDLLAPASIKWKTPKGKVSECEQPRNHVAFRFTIGSLSEHVLSVLEPGAPSLSERISALTYATNAGFQTSISCEPLLDESPCALVEKLIPLLSPTNRAQDSGVIWIGCMNAYVKAEKVRQVYGPECAELFEKAIEYAKFPNVIKYYTQYVNDPHVKFKETIKRMMISNNIWIEELLAKV